MGFPECVCSTSLIWAVILVLVGLKIYVVVTTIKCPSRKRIIGKTAIITGATSGIGREIAFGMVWRGARVILACRNVEKAKQIQEEIYKRSECPKSRVEVYHLDLESLDSVRKFAKEVCEKEERIDILINNAATSGQGNKKTADGLQITMQVNHLAPLLLTCLLVEKLKKSAPSRIVWVTSKLHGCAKFDVHNMNCEKSFSSESQVYFSSKLANIFVSNTLAQRLHGTGVTVNAVDPGFTDTDIWRHLPAGLHAIWSLILKFYFKTPFEAAQTPIFAAVDPFQEYATGRYFAACREALPSLKAQDILSGKIAFEKSLELLGLKNENLTF